MIIIDNYVSMAFRCFLLRWLNRFVVLPPEEPTTARQSLQITNGNIWHCIAKPFRYHWHWVIPWHNLLICHAACYNSCCTVYNMSPREKPHELILSSQHSHLVCCLHAMGLFTYDNNNEVMWGLETEARRH